MSADSTMDERIVNIEIRIDRSGISAEELDSSTRRLAGELRQIPHRSVGIISDQAVTSGIAARSAQEPTEGTIAMSLEPTNLPKVLKVLQTGFTAGQRRSVKLKGPQGIELDLTGPVSQEQTTSWLNSVMKQSSIGTRPGEQNRSLPDNPAVASVQEMRDRARRHLETGAVTEEYTADRAQVLKLLNEALASELVCILRYKSHYYRVAGINSEAVKPEFLQHAQEAQQHADLIAARIVQLNGQPNFNPEGLTSRSRTEYKPASTLMEMIKEDLVAERIAVEFYSEIICWLGDADLTTRKVMQEILAVEAEHAEDMKNLLGKLSR